MKVSLSDQEGLAMVVEYVTRADGSLRSDFIHADHGFGATHTESAMIDGIDISGDLWRFIEGTLGIEVLHESMNSPSFGRDFLIAFKEKFRFTEGDEQAMRLWDSLKSGRLAQANAEAECEWQSACDECEWGAEAQVKLLEGFLREKGIFGQFSEYAQKAAREENPELMTLDEVLG